MESAFQYIVAINFGTDLCGYAFIIRDDLKKDSDPTKITAPIWETADGGHSYLCFAG